MMDTFDLFFERVEHFLKWMCTALVMGLTVLVFFSVLFRYLFNNPLDWADEMVGFFILGLTYFGSAVACGRRSQIYVEILESALKKNPRALRWIRVIIDGIVMTVLILMVFVGFRLCLNSQTQKTGILVLSYFWVYMIMPVGAGFMVLMIIKRLIQDLRRGLETNSSRAH
jgi:TRAP-type C4-dicarboxylate transport system permease small subunit